MGAFITDVGAGVGRSDTISRAQGRPGAAVCPYAGKSMFAAAGLARGKVVSTSCDRHGEPPAAEREHEALAKNHANLDRVANYYAKSAGRGDDAGTPSHGSRGLHPNVRRPYGQLDAP